MERPAVSQAAEELYEFLEAFTEEDEDTGWETLLWCEALTGGTAQKILRWVTDRDDMPGWAYLFNADLTDEEALPWLSQLNGSKLRPDMSVQEQRDAIENPSGFERGTPESLEAAPVNYLTGTKLVLLRERLEGNAYRLQIRTLKSETPDKAAVLAALLLQKPATLRLDYDVIDGQDWLDLKADHIDWNAVKADYATWDDVRSDIP